MEIIVKGISSVLDDGTTIVYSVIVPDDKIYHLFIMPAVPTDNIINSVAGSVHVIEISNCLGYYSYLRPDGFTDFAVNNTYPEPIIFNWAVVSIT